MEDIALRNVVFPNTSNDISLEQIQGLLRTLATLHSQFWQSPRLLTDLAWIATPLAGGMSDIFQQYGYELVKDQVDKHTFKQDLIAPLNLSLETVAEKLQSFQLEAMQQTQTVLHGDTHIANTYLPPDADTAWYLYRKSIMCGLFIGWLITPPAKYGEEITSANIRKLVQATQDLESFVQAQHLAMRTPSDDGCPFHDTHLGPVVTRCIVLYRTVIPERH